MLLRRLLVVLLAAWLSACEQPKLPSPFHAIDVTAKFRQVELQLADHNGRTRTLADFRGRVVVLFFGYTQCPDICPTTLSDLARVMELLGKEAERVQVLFVTVDPERDTSELLAQYVPAFHPSFLALRGDAAATAQAAKTFDVFYQKQPTTSGYSMDHSAGTFMIDPKGGVRLLAPHGQRPERLAEDIRLLLTGV